MEKYLIDVQCRIKAGNRLQKSTEKYLMGIHRESISKDRYPEWKEGVEFAVVMFNRSCPQCTPLRVEEFSSDNKDNGDLYLYISDGKNYHAQVYFLYHKVKEGEHG